MRIMYNYTSTNIIHMLLAVTCDLPTQLLNFLVTVVNESQDNPYIEGQFITYTCPPGFVLTGPNTSVCTGIGEWEPDPGHVICIGNYYACTQGPKAQICDRAGCQDTKYGCIYSCYSYSLSKINCIKYCQ